MYNTDRLGDARKYIDNAISLLNVQTISHGQITIWLKFLALNAKAICSARGQDYTKAC
jgi:hypothetical protein